MTKGQKIKTQQNRQRQKKEEKRKSAEDETPKIEPNTDDMEAWKEEIVVGFVCLQKMYLGGLQFL